jgi:Tol biopolymer transport system component
MVWSPDSEKISYETYEIIPPQDPSLSMYKGIGGPTSLDVINVDGTGYKRLFTNKVGDLPLEGVPPEYTPFHATWSPDGQQIAFNITEGGIHKINADGSGLTLLNKDGRDPSWSPDGTKILFYSCEFTDDQNPALKFVDCASAKDLSIMNPDGSKVIQLTKDPDPYDGWTGEYAFNAIWSPDSKWIAFKSDRDKVECGKDGGKKYCEEIYVMKADGTSPTRITNESTYKDYIYWIP